MHIYNWLLINICSGHLQNGLAEAHTHTRKPPRDHRLSTRAAVCMMSISLCVESWSAGMKITPQVNEFKFLILNENSTALGQVLCVLAETKLDE